MQKIQQVLEILENHKNLLPGDDEQAKNKFYVGLGQEVDQLSKRTPEDRRQASLIAVDAAKTFAQIGVAGIIALGAFTQYGLTNNWGAFSIVCLALAGLATVWSLQHGMRVISTAARRGEGREGSSDVPWSTLALKNNLGLQGLAGLVALVLFVLAIAASSWSSPLRQGFGITLPNGTELSSPAESVTATGQWSKLEIRDKGGTIVQLPSVPKGQIESIKVEDQ